VARRFERSVVLVEPSLECPQFARGDLERRRDAPGTDAE